MSRTCRCPECRASSSTQLLATGVPTILVVVSGRPYALGDYAERAAAIVQAFMPGEEGGRALAGVLSGRVNPTGKLPVQIPARPGAQPSTYLQPPLGAFSDGVSSLDPTPLFPFGHGLSYTTYRLQRPRDQRRRRSPTDGEVTVSATVRNTGNRAGEEIVQLYLHDVQAQVTRPLSQLIGFTRVTPRARPGRPRRLPRARGPRRLHRCRPPPYRRTRRARGVRRAIGHRPPAHRQLHPHRARPGGRARPGADHTRCHHRPQLTLEQHVGGARTALPGHRFAPRSLAAGGGSIASHESRRNDGTDGSRRTGWGPSRRGSMS